jgi:Fe-S cluster biogenesis protein NfuA
VAGGEDDELHGSTVRLRIIVPVTELLDDTERAARKAALDSLMDLMRPAVQADGGDLVVTDVDYDAGIVDVQLQGACGSCAISGMTLEGGVQRLLKDRLAWVTEVRGSVDDSLDVFESTSLGRGGYVPKGPLSE